MTAVRNTSAKELSLLQHVKKTATQGDPESVLKAIDTFCWQGQWMMHIGDEKGKLLDDALAQAHPISAALELGTYCGYSALRVARMLPPGARLMAVDPSDVPATVAAPILEHAGLRDKVELVRATASEALELFAKQGLQFDAVLIDHDKDLYLPDLRLIEKLKLLKPGAVVVADNVVMFKLEAYLQHVRGSGHYSSSVLHKAHVEYEREKEDGVEVSVYCG